MRHIWRWLMALLVVGGVGGAVWYTWFREPPVEKTDVVSTKVKRTTVIRKVQGVGHVEPVTQVRVSSNVTGDLLALHVREGDKVTRGTLLAEIDKERLLAAVRQAEANAGSAEAGVALEAARHGQAVSEANRATQMYKEKLTSDAELVRMTSAVGVSEASVAGAKQRVAQAKAALDEARSRLMQTRITAPADGTVISLEKKLGERIRGSDLAEDILLVLAPLHAMEVEVEVSEQDVVRVERGQVAEVSVDALGGQKIPGKVVEIATNALIKNRGTEMETTSYKVKVALDNIPERLRSGMSAAVAIVTDTHPNVLAVPLEAVTARLPSELTKRADDPAHKKEKKEDKEEEEKSVAAVATRVRERPVKLVFAVVNDKAEVKQVKTSISSDSEIEIAEGLKEGEEILIGPYRALSKTIMAGTMLKVTAAVETKPDAGVSTAGAASVDGGGT